MLALIPVSFHHDSAAAADGPQWLRDYLMTFKLPAKVPERIKDKAQGGRGRCCLQRRDLNN